jgi:hypothetical protein
MPSNQTMQPTAGPAYCRALIHENRSSVFDSHFHQPRLILYSLGLMRSLGIALCFLIGAYPAMALEPAGEFAKRTSFWPGPAGYFRRGCGLSVSGSTRLSRVACARPATRGLALRVGHGSFGLPAVARLFAGAVQSCARRRARPQWIRIGWVNPFSSGIIAWTLLVSLISGWGALFYLALLAVLVFFLRAERGWLLF